MAAKEKIEIGEKQLKNLLDKLKGGKLSLKIGIAMAAVIVALAGVLTALFAYNTERYKDHFLPGTYIDGLDCGDLTVEEAEAALSQRNYELKVISRSWEPGVVTAEEIGYAYTSEGAVAELMAEQDGSAWFGNHEKKEFFTGNISWDEEKLQNAVQALDFLQKMEQPVDARVSYENGGFVILPEQEGEAVDPAELAAAVAEAVEKGAGELVLEEEDLYLKPEVTSDDEALAQRKAELEELVSASITYDLPGGQVKVLDKETLATWLAVDENGGYYKDDALYEEKLQAFIKELELQVDSKGKSWTFNSTLRGPVTVTGGTYGWEISNSAELEQLRQELESHAVVEREPVYLQRGNDTAENGGIGNTYAEVDMNAQHMWYYENGQLMLESDVVTGKLTPDRYTPEGVWQLFYKQRDRTLVGEIDPKTNQPSYRQPVSYWMNFTSLKLAIGFHDLYNVYGNPERYINYGSHGCVNMPKDKAAALYELIQEGTPVITFYPEGYTLKE